MHGHFSFPHAPFFIRVKKLEAACCELLILMDSQKVHQQAESGQALSRLLKSPKRTF